MKNSVVEATIVDAAKKQARIVQIALSQLVEEDKISPYTQTLILHRILQLMGATVEPVAT